MASVCKHTLFLSLVLSFFLANSSALSEPEILLQFKASVKDSMDALSDWTTTPPSPAHHCNWTGVSCTNTSPFLVTGLDLQSLNLSGEISASLCSISSLSHLNLAGNLFNQPLPLHLSQCVSLLSLNLSNNLIWGTIPEQISLFNPLEVLDLSRNHIEGRIPETIGLLGQLRVLNLGSNLLSGIVPVGFSNFTALRVLDLSHNPFLVSEIPVDFSQLSSLEDLLLQSSGFYGEMNYDMFKGLKGLKVVDISENNLAGNLPKIGSFLPNLVSFDASQNKLSGPFPNGVCEAKGLVVLSLHNNYFNGSIPNEFINGCKNLERFEVQNNGFSKNFPSQIWSFPRIKLIRGDNNRFTGEIPDSISEAGQLEHVQIDNNSFMTKFPLGVGKVKTLYRFSASLNKLYGELPLNFCDSPVMSIFNLSHNSLSGRVPEVRQCRKLVSLSLADNRFFGEIPGSLAGLPVLTYLDLSQNNLSGSVPEELGNLKLALFNISFNRLTGRVPSLLISGLPASFLQGNPGLCGPGLPTSCLNDAAISTTSGFAKLTCALVSIAVALGLLVLVFGFYVVRSRNRSCRASAWKSVFFYPLRVTEHDLITAMDDKASRGNGNFGRVYIVNLPSGEAIAVKKILHFANRSSTALRNKVKTLAKIRHKNIVKILGFCHSDDSILLIYEYVPNGSLRDLLSQDFNLPWSVRLRIAIGIAQGLAYLHKDYLPHLLHGNLKSSNVLLDAEFQPKITDFALDRVVGENTMQSVVALESPSSCYFAPEYGQTKKATEQSDAYSFGIVLLELLTGRHEERSGLGEDYVDVLKWVRRKINIVDGASKVLDPKLPVSGRKAMLEALEIGLECTSVVPEKRPCMAEVVRALESLVEEGDLTLTAGVDS